MEDFINTLFITKLIFQHIFITQSLSIGIGFDTGVAQVWTQQETSVTYSFNVQTTGYGLFDMKYSHLDDTLAIVHSNVISFYNITNGQMIYKIDYAPNKIKFFPNGWMTCIRSFVTSWEVTVWNITANMQLYRFPTSLDIISLHPLNNLKMIATGDLNGTLTIWNLNGSTQMQSSYHRKGLHILDQLPNGFLITVSYDPMIALWNISNDTPLSSVMPFDWNNVRALKVISNDEIVVGGDTNYIAFVHIFYSSWTMLKVKTVYLSCNNVRSVSLLSGNILAIAGDDNFIHIYDMTSSSLSSTPTSGGTASYVVALENRNVSAVKSPVLRSTPSQVPNANQIAIFVSDGNLNNKVLIWDWYSQQIVSWYTDYTDWIECIKLMSDGLFMVGSSSNGLFVYNSSTKVKLQQANLYVVDLKDMNNRTTLTTASIDGFHILNYTDILRQTSFIPSESRLNTFQILDNGNLVGGMSNGNISIWNPIMQVKIKTLSSHTGKVNILELVKSDILISGSSDATVKLWNVTFGLCLATINPFNNEIHHMILLANDMVVVGGHSPKIVFLKINMAASNLTPVNTIFAPSGWVQSLAVNAQNILFISSGIDKLVLYDIVNSLYIDVQSVPLNGLLMYNLANYEMTSYETLSILTHQSNPTTIITTVASYSEATLPIITTETTTTTTTIAINQVTNQPNTNSPQIVSISLNDTLKYGCYYKILKDQKISYTSTDLIKVTTVPGFFDCLTRCQMNNTCQTAQYENQYRTCTLLNLKLLNVTPTVVVSIGSKIYYKLF